MVNITTDVLVNNISLILGLKQITMLVNFLDERGSGR
jgi:hypothetical protein